MRSIELTSTPDCIAIKVRRNRAKLNLQGTNVFRQIAIWTATILLGTLFVLIGFSKFSGPSGVQWAVRLSHWGYPAASRYAIGGIEMLAGIGLFVPPVRRWAAITMIIVMAGALVTHLIHGEWIRLLPPLLFGGWAYGLFAYPQRSTDQT